MSSTPAALALPDAVLWDMDGTLVDTEPYWIECEFELVERFGDSWDLEKAHSLVGHDLRDSARIMQARGGVRLEVDDIVNRLLDGARVTTIAAALYISPSTVRNHLSAVYRTARVHSQAELIELLRPTQ